MKTIKDKSIFAVKKKRKGFEYYLRVTFLCIGPKITIPTSERLINHLLVVIIFSLAFIGVAEVMYWLYKKEYLRAKAKYLRELIDQKNDLSSLNEPFYACVYEKWNSGEMPLTEANTMCSLKFEHN